MKIFSFNTVVVGTGASGYNAADCLYQKGQQDIAMITEHKNAGTSRNTGSDKQTYYKLSLAGNTPDSVAMLAEVLFHGECVDGDIALCEASLSAQGFYKLAELGVPFPKNCYGEYIGYKTDHDPSKRATSVGPYTSKIMTECLERSVVAKGIPIFDGYQVLRILTDEENKSAIGLLCLELKSKEYVAFRCTNIIYATGGPAGIYADSVYPMGQYGASGIAFLAGVHGKNLTEWQYGIASIKPRWNVSGTYMQALPKFVSTNQAGEDEKEFLLDFFSDTGEMLSKIFMKGYQWPFDVRKIDGGSSIIDVLVYIEVCMKGRRVFLDFRENVKGKEVDFSTMTEEARAYLEKAQACFGTPIERLLHMNQPAVDFYADKGVDLRCELLEIALCAQHNNGGLAIDKWWQTNLKGMFAVGEVSASHGVYRPGGSALNAGQVGSARAAEYIAAKGRAKPLTEADFLGKAKEQIVATEAFEYLAFDVAKIDTMWKYATKRMSQIGAAIRNQDAIAAAIVEIAEELQQFDTSQCKERNVMLDKKCLWKLHRLYDMLIAQYVYLNAMADYIKVSARSRGSALYTAPNGKLAYDTLPEAFRFQLDDGHFSQQVQEIVLKHLECNAIWRDVRKIPVEDDFFENVWREFRRDGNIH